MGSDDYKEDFEVLTANTLVGLCCLFRINLLTNLKLFIGIEQFSFECKACVVISIV